MPSPKAAAVGPDAFAPLDQVSANMPGHCVPVLLFLLHMTVARVTFWLLTCIVCHAS